MATEATINITSDITDSISFSISESMTMTQANSNLDLEETTGLAQRTFSGNTTQVVLIDVDIHDTNVGRLYAGDWMFVPWSMTDSAAEWVIEAEPAGAVCPYEFALFQEPQTLVSHS